MLSKKIIVQKSFRIDAYLERDLELLSKKLERPQNDLVNFSLNQLMLDNIGWFVEDYLISLCSDFLDKKVQSFSINIKGLSMKMWIDESKQHIKFEYEISSEDYSEKGNSTFIGSDIGFTLLENVLKDIALKMGQSSSEIQEFLTDRFNYIYSKQKEFQKFDRMEFIKQSIGDA